MIAIRETPPIASVARRLLAAAVRGPAMVLVHMAELAATAERIVTPMVREQAPKRSGRLAREQRVSVLPVAGGFVVTWSSGVPYARYVIGGTRAHTITAHGRALRFEWHGATMYRRSVYHPETKPNPFPRRALERALPLLEAEARLTGRAILREHMP